MTKSFPQVVLPDGKRVSCLNRAETLIVYNHVQGYFTHGITLRNGDVVFDVGANFGLFTLAAWKRCGPDGTIYAFEPIPTIFAALRQNIERHGLGRVQVFPCGVSREKGRRTFTFYPRLPAVSTAYPEGWREELIAIFVDNPAQLPGYLRWVPALPRPVRVAVIRFVIKPFMKQESVTCDITNLSQVIRDGGIERIDLLKVDVEKSELDVLLGIGESDWPKIRQVVAEVHAVGDRIEQIVALLEGHGFPDVLVEQEAGYRHSDIFNLYARR